jgi:hypothetical protein
MTAPIRKIIHTTGAPDRSTARMIRRPGKITSATLECGHELWANAGDVRQGKMYCFDCFYNKPVTGNAQITLDMLGLTAVQ